MTPQQKKEYIKKLKEQGDTRSWNEIAVDLELVIWTAKYKGKEILENVHKTKEEVSRRNRKE